MSALQSLGVVRLGSMDLAVPGELIEEVMRGPIELSPFPRALPHVLGAFAFRGAPLPVVDFAAVLKPAAAAVARPVAYLVIIRHPAGRFAFLADEVLNVVHAPAETITALHPEAANSSARNLFSRLYTPPEGGRVVVILDLEAVLAVDGLRSAMASVAEVSTSAEELAQKSRPAHVLFQAGKACFALDVQHVRLVERRWSQPAAAPSDVVLRGFRRFRDDDLAVVDLLALLQLPADEEAAGEPHFVVVERGGQAVALTVGAIVAIERFARAELSPLPEGGMARPEFYAGGWVGPAGKIVLVLDPATLIDAASVVDRGSLFAKTSDAADAATAGSIAGEFARYIVYRAGGGTLATPLRELEAVMNLPEDFVDLRGRRHALVGMCARLGRSFKVVDLGALMGRPHPRAEPGAPLLVVRTGEATVGYLVESIDFLQGAIPRALPHASGRGPGKLPAFRQMIRARAENFDRAASVLTLAGLAGEPAGALTD